MNHSVYYFVSSPEQHRQYPMDFSSEIFSSYAKDLSAESCISVRRESDLVYYTYLRRLSSDFRGKTVFGISIVFNSVITYNIQALFKIFERSFERLVISGKMLQFTDNGEVAIESSGWDSAENASGEISSLINSYLEEGSGHFEVIPPINYGASTEDVAYVSLSEGEREIRNLIVKYQTTYVTKKNDISSKKFNSYASKLARLEEENSLQKALIVDLRSNRSTSSHIPAFVWMLAIIAVLAISLIVFGYFTGHVLIR